jgi:hypothetical protein
MFITADGSLGMVAGNCHIQVDDEVHVLFGGVTPFVLRKNWANYRLMGPCYIHGYMHGSAVEDVRRGRVKVQEVTIV